MKAIRFYKLVILVLLLVNAGTLFALWKGRPEHGHQGKPKSIIGVLGLSGSNKSKVQVLEKAHFKAKSALVHKSIRLHKRLHASFSAEKADSVEVEKLINDIVVNQREMEQMTYDYFKTINQYCDAKQKVLLKEAIGFAIQQMSAGRPPRR